MLYSYDIFDTLLYRKVLSPGDIFILMQENPSFSDIWDASRGSFSRIRRETEKRLRGITRKEITIYDIYSEIGRIANISDKACQQLLEIEFDTECRYSFLNKVVYEQIKQLLSLQERVVLISDMYWDEKHLRRLLQYHDDIFAIVPIYVSCEWSASKLKGTLYKKVKAVEKADYLNWQHTGDNKISDYRVPCMLGIMGRRIEGPKRYHYERTINEYTLDTSKIYGIISQCRQNTNGDAFDIGVSFTAPMAYQYVDWVLENAQRQGIETLYFVLRDGYILKKIADEMIKRRNIGIKTYYIFGSRVAWRLPEVTLNKLKSLSGWEKSNWIFRDPSYAFVPLERLGFDRAFLLSVFGKDFYTQKLCSFSDFKSMLMQALQNAAFTEKLQKNIALEKRAVNIYMAQTIDWSKKFAFVDTNSTGKSQQVLNSILLEQDPTRKPLKFFYHTYLGSEETNDFQCIFIDGRKEDRRFPEALFRAPYNPCYGYKVTEHGKAEPRFFESEYCAWYGTFDYDSYLKGIMAFTKAMEQERENTKKLVLDEYVALLLDVANFDIPSNDINKIIARIPFHPDLNGNEKKPFYPEAHISALLHPFSELIYYPKATFYLKGGAWPYLYKALFYAVKAKRKILTRKKW